MYAYFFINIFEALCGRISGTYRFVAACVGKRTPDAPLIAAVWPQWLQVLCFLPDFLLREECASVGVGCFVGMWV